MRVDFIHSEVHVGRLSADYDIGSTFLCRKVPALTCLFIIVH